MKYRHLLTILALIIITCTQAQIQSYEKFIGEYIDIENKINYIVLRRIRTSDCDSTQYLVLHPMSLETKLISSYGVKKKDWNFLQHKYQSTFYIKIRDYAKQFNNKNKLANAGIKNVKNKGGFIITTDLCPSSNALEYSLYENIFTKIKKNGTRNIPFGIAVTGVWIKQHTEELKWLLTMEKEENISITWINHSYSHKYIKGRQLQSNFLLIKETDIEKEILDLEKLMLEEKLNLSIYFRFPGLISDSVLYNQILDYGLIPLGSDSWIAKDQFPKEGSIVLLHGNGNEHIGVVKFKKWFDSNWDKFKINAINTSFLQYFQTQTAVYHNTYK